METDNATAIIVTAAERARDMRQRPVYVMGVVAASPGSVPIRFITTPRLPHVAGKYAAERVFGMAGVSPERIFSSRAHMMRLPSRPCCNRDYGFCQKGAGGAYVSSGIIELGGKRRITPMVDICARAIPMA